MAQERSASALRSFQNTANEPHCGDLGGGLQKASGAVQRHGDSCPCWKVLEGAGGWTLRAMGLPVCAAGEGSLSWDWEGRGHSRCFRGGGSPQQGPDTQPCRQLGETPSLLGQPTRLGLGAPLRGPGGCYTQLHPQKFSVQQGRRVGTGGRRLAGETRPRSPQSWP